MPKVALRPSAFMRICLSGSTTDPVIKKRTTKVTTTTIASTRGRCSARLSWRSRNPAVAPVASAGLGIQQILDQLAAALVEGSVLGDDVDRVYATRELHRRPHVGESSRASSAIRAARRRRR